MLKRVSFTAMQHHVKQGLALCNHAPVAIRTQGSPEDVEGAMASIFVWLRYSSARHLTWQRNYNTQPRILGEAQAKLTHKIAEVPPFANCCFSQFHRQLKCLHVFQLPPASDMAILHAACMAQTCVRVTAYCYQHLTIDTSKKANLYSESLKTVSVTMCLADGGTRSSSI
jgi:hypothetical protein